MRDSLNIIYKADIKKLSPNKTYLGFYHVHKQTKETENTCDYIDTRSKPGY